MIMEIVSVRKSLSDSVKLCRCMLLIGISMGGRVVWLGLGLFTDFVILSERHKRFKVCLVIGRIMVDEIPPRFDTVDGILLVDDVLSVDGIVVVDDVLLLVDDVLLLVDDALLVNDVLLVDDMLSFDVLSIFILFMDVSRSFIPSK